MNNFIKLSFVAGAQEAQQSFNPKLAYDAGVQQAMLDAGLVKHADRTYTQLPYSHQWWGERTMGDFEPGGWKYVDDPNTPGWYDKRLASGWDFEGFPKDPSDFFKVRGGTSRTPTFPEPSLPIPTAEEQKAQMSIPDEDLPNQSTPGPVSY